MIFSGKAILCFVIGIVTAQIPSRAPCIWLFKSDTNTKGGIQTAYGNLTECQENCLKKDSCLNGIDWDPNNANGIKCWFSTQASYGSSPGVTHYYQSCAGSLTTDSYFTMLSTTTTATTPRDCGWIVTNDTNTKDGVLVAEANTILDCKLKCSKRPECINGLGFDFNLNSPVGQRCYLSTNKDLFPTPGIVHYQPMNTCAGSVTNASTSVNTSCPVFLMLLLLLGRLYAL